MRLFLLFVLAIGCCCSADQKQETMTPDDLVSSFKTDGKEADTPAVESAGADAKDGDSEASVPEVKKAKEAPFVAHFKKGKIEGYQATSPKGRTYYAFRSVPYCEPPVGDLRFKIPVRSEPWEEVVDTRPAPTPCAQFDLAKYSKSGVASYVGDEDCLFLSVYTPEFDEAVADMPVMVFFPGTAYAAGQSDIYDPGYFIDENVIVVVVQYRLGIFGFLSTEDKVVQGNFGLMDQVVALRWVKDNIHNFGGNSLRVTIFGHGSGASSIHFQMFSHHSIGLFQKVILQSGTAVCPWAMGGVHRAVAFHLGEQFDCAPDGDTEEDIAEAAAAEALEEETVAAEEAAALEEQAARENASETAAEDADGSGDAAEEESAEPPRVPYNKFAAARMRREQRSDDLRQCLQKVDAKTLALKIIEYYSFGNLPVLFGPRPDERYIVHTAEDYLLERRHKKIEMIIGITKDEGSDYANALFANEGLRQRIIANFPEYAPISLEFTDDDVAPVNMSISAYDYYAGGIDIEEKDARNLTGMFGDRHHKVPADIAAMIHTVNNPANKPIYFYEFHHKGEKSRSDNFDISVSKDWVAHGDDLIYMFPNTSSTALNEDDEKVARLMVKMWSNFAKTGNPNSEDMDFKWDRFTKDDPRHLVITTEPYMADDTRREIRNFWTSLPTRQNMLLFPENVDTTLVTETEGESEAEDITDETSEAKDSGSQKITNDDAKSENEPSSSKDEL